MPFCSIRVTDEEKKVIEQYAAFNNITISEAMKAAFFDRLEDEYDIKCADEAYRQFLKDPKTVPLKDVADRYGL